MPDINECSTKLGLRSCGSNKECINTPGGYDCVDKKSTKKVTTKWVNGRRCCFSFSWLNYYDFRSRFGSESVVTHKPLTCTKGYQQQGDNCVGECDLNCKNFDFISMENVKFLFFLFFLLFPVSRVISICCGLGQWDNDAITIRHWWVYGRSECMRQQSELHQFARWLLVRMQNGI